MIEVNLHPDASRRSARRSLKLPFSLPKGGSLGGLDRANAAVAAAWIIAPAIILWMYLSTGSRIDDLQVAVESAVADSARYARLIEAQERLQAQRDTIAEKLVIIQEIDAGRYIWPHILDEISRALPEYTWLTRLEHRGGTDNQPGFQIVGRAGNIFALTRFMTELEESPFIRDVELTSTEMVREANDRTVHAFTLEARYEEPPPEMVEMVPLLPVED